MAGDSETKKNEEEREETGEGVHDNNEAEEGFGSPVRLKHHPTNHQAKRAEARLNTQPKISWGNLFVGALTPNVGLVVSPGDYVPHVPLVKNRAGKGKMDAQQ